MPLQFVAPVYLGPIRQGEVLSQVLEYRSLHPAYGTEDNPEVVLESISHPLTVVFTPDCDLMQDFAARFPEQFEFPAERMEQMFRETPEKYLISHILLCDAFDQGQIREDVAGADIFKRIKRNHDDRYHHLVGTLQAQDDEKEIDIYLDFKTMFSLPTDQVYSAINERNEMRLTTVPPIYVHDLIHRFYGFQSRVGLPD